MSININQAGRNNTLQSFLTSLSVNAILLAIQVSAFVILKHKLERIYSPRTYLPPVERRANELPKGPWRWLPAVLSSPMEDIMHKNGLDAYMFLRFLRMLIWIFLVFTVVTWVVLLPIDAININPSLSDLDRFSWANITGPNHERRYAAHIIIAYLLTLFVLFMIRREMLLFLELRHQFLISKSHSRLAQARTVLITRVPDELGDENELRTFASFVPGGVDRVWLYRDTKTLNALFNDRQRLCDKLEGAVIRLLRLAMKAWAAKTLERRKVSKSQANNDVEQGEHGLPLPEMVTREFLDELVPHSKRPTHTVGFMSFGGRVDTIDWCKDEISRLNKEIDAARASNVLGKFLGSAFLRCNLQMGAHVLAQCISHHKPLAMYDKWLETSPKDIVWENLDEDAFKKGTHYLVSWTATIGLIVLWAFPAAFIGSLSNLGSLCQKFRWAEWLCAAHKPIPGLVQGVLPPLLLAVVFVVLPLILRLLAWYECIPRYSLMSVSVYRRFFMFLLIHGFLIVTLTSGITAAIKDILNKPATTLQSLSTKLPQASTFFMTYMVTQGLAGSSSALVQLGTIVLYYLRKWFFGRTPRQAYAVTFLMPAADFGVVLPPLSLLATIGFAYSIISPIINGLALCTFVLHYIAWKFLLMQVFDQPPEFETGGLYFPRAISSLFTGLYIEQVCLGCLYFLQISWKRNQSISEGIFMVVLALITVATQVVFHLSFAPITQYLPMSLATKKLEKMYQKKKKREKGNFVSLAEEISTDMFRLDRNRMKSIRKRLKFQRKGSKYKSGTGQAEIDVEGSAREEKTIPEDLPSISIASPQSREEEKTIPEDLPSISIASPQSNNLEVMDEDEAEQETQEPDDENAFAHPSTYQDQPVIWVPKDPLGLSKILVKEFNEAGAGASDLGAVMDDKGVVEVSTPPPGETWKADPVNDQVL